MRLSSSAFASLAAPLAARLRPRDSAVRGLQRGCAAVVEVARTAVWAEPAPLPPALPQRSHGHGRVVLTIAAVTVVAAAATAAYVWWRRQRMDSAEPAATAVAEQPPPTVTVAATVPLPRPAGEATPPGGGKSQRTTRPATWPSLQHATRPPVPGGRFAMPGACTVLPARGYSLP